MKGELVQLNGNRNQAETQNGEGLVNITRRRFLQVLGATSAVGAAACASPAKQEILPYLERLHREL